MNREFAKLYDELRERQTAGRWEIGPHDRYGRYTGHRKVYKYTDKQNRRWFLEQIERRGLAN